MTVLEKGKFVKNFVRIDKNGRLVRVPHSNRIGYSSNDIAKVYPKVDEAYWNNWEKFLKDIKEDGKWSENYPDWQHFLFALNSIDEKDVKKYNLPNDFIVIKIEEE